MLASLEAYSPWLVALPWLIVPLWVYWRATASRSLADYAPARGDTLPLVTVIVPARDEAPNIARCVRSILATTWARLELIVVDDHSTDGTGRIAWDAMAGDARARVTVPPPLPDGWFGKQWACAHGASLATGDLLLFTDADTWHAPDLVSRAITAFTERRADLLTVMGRLETGSFWEHVVQPAMSTGFFTLFGGTEAMSRPRAPRHRLASGQFILVRSEGYDALGGHGAVRGYVAEDVMLAQTWAAAGRNVQVVTGIEHLSVRMYRSLREIVHGWGKNMWAGGRHFLPDLPLVTTVARVVSPLSPVGGALPGLLPLLALLGVVPAWWGTLGAAGYAYQTAVWWALYRRVGARPAYALTYPLACAVIFWIVVRGVVRGSRTEWKGREYRAA